MTALLRTSGARVATLFAMVAALMLLVVGGASAQSDDCYPLPADGCEEPEVQPSVVESPPTTNPAPEPSTPSTPQTEPEELAQTGLESSTIGFIAAGLLVAGGAAIAAGRRRETADA